jgi:hypothetical protein
LSAAASCKPLEAAAASAAAKEYATVTPLLLGAAAEAAGDVACCSSRRLLVLLLLLAGVVPVLLTVDFMLLAGTPEMSETAFRLPAAYCDWNSSAVTPTVQQRRQQRQRKCNVTLAHGTAQNCLRDVRHV